MIRARSRKAIRPALRLPSAYKPLPLAAPPVQPTPTSLCNTACSRNTDTGECRRLGLAARIAVATLGLAVYYFFVPQEKAPPPRRVLELLLCLWIVAAQVWYYSQFADLVRGALKPLLGGLWR